MRFFVPLIPIGVDINVIDSIKCFMFKLSVYEPEKSLSFIYVPKTIALYSPNCNVRKGHALQ